MSNRARRRGLRRIGPALLAGLLLAPVAGAGAATTDPAWQPGRHLWGWGGGDAASAAPAISAPAARPSAREQARRYVEALEAAVPRATAATPLLTTAGQARPETMSDFLSAVLASLERYWAKTFAAAGLPAPSVAHQWVPVGGAAESACLGPGEALPSAEPIAFYCPTDDTLAIGEEFAYKVWTGLLAGTAGGTIAPDSTFGDFGVATIVAHEFGHNLQSETGILGLGLPVVRTELQADCFAGAWANSVYREGLLEDGDVAEAISASLAYGDFNLDSPGHHGTPDQRVAAWRLGYQGDPAACGTFLDAPPAAEEPAPAEEPVA